MEQQVDTKTEIAVGLLNTRFFVLVMIGAMTVVLTSIKPFVVANNIPAAIILVLLSVTDYWKSAKIGQLKLIFILMLVLAAWVDANLIVGWFPHPLAGAEDADLAEFFKVLGIIGCTIIMVGAIQALKGLKLLKAAEK